MVVAEVGFGPNVLPSTLSIGSSISESDMSDDSPAIPWLLASPDAL